MRAGLWGLVAGFAIVMGAPASAAPTLYKVTPQAVPADGTLILHDLAWRCASGSCVALRSGRSTDVTVCSSVARGIGRLAAFEVGDAPFDAAALEKCNSRAR